MAKISICSIDECGKPSRTRGLCNGHYWRLLKHGNPLAGGLSRGACLIWLEQSLLADTQDCIIWPFKALVKGYPVITIGHQLLKVSRFVCERVHGPAPENNVAAHSCATPACVNKNHLRWATHQENAQDKIDHGNAPRGSLVGISKLKEQDIPVIRRRLAAGSSKAQIARDYGVTDVAIGAVARGKTWRHVKG